MFVLHYSGHEKVEISKVFRQDFDIGGLLFVSMSVLFWSREVESEPNNANVTLSRNNHNLQFSTFLCEALNMQN